MLRAAIATLALTLLLGCASEEPLPDTTRHLHEHSHGPNSHSHMHEHYVDEPSHTTDETPHDHAH